MFEEDLGEGEQATGVAGVGVELGVRIRCDRLHAYFRRDIPDTGIDEDGAAGAGQEFRVLREKLMGIEGIDAREGEGFDASGDFGARAVIATERVAVADDEGAINGRRWNGGRDRLTRQTRGGCRGFALVRLLRWRPDQASRVTSSRTAPPGPIRRTCIGILPRAWVEQLRHGSKLRMPCSTRLRTPSGISGPVTYFFAIS